MSLENAEPRLILLAGAGLRTTVWKDLEPHLTHPSEALEVEGSGDKRGTMLYLEEYVSQIVRQINRSPGPLVLVGHSIGGMLATQVMEHPDLKGRVQGLAIIASVLPRGGQSFAGGMPWPISWVMPMLLRLAGTTPPDAVLARELCSGLSKEQTRKILAEFQAEPRCLYTGSCRTWKGPAQRLYIKTSRDRTISPVLQDRMRQRLEPCEQAELATGHLPMLEAPRELAAHLNALAARS